MRKLAIAAAIGLSCLGSTAQADERAGGAAIGAVSGAVILGPVGAVAGAAIGYVAGASAKSSNKSSRPKRARPARSATGQAQAFPRPRPQAADARGATASTIGAAPQEAREDGAAPAGRPDPATPPMQGFE